MVDTVGPRRILELACLHRLVTDWNPKVCPMIRHCIADEGRSLPQGLFFRMDLPQSIFGLAESEASGASLRDEVDRVCDT